MSRYNRSPRQLAGALESLASRLAPTTALAEVQGAWNEAVGEGISERARPIAERAGVLTIACESSVWAQELDLMNDAILERLNRHLRSTRIVRLRCVVAAALGQV
jgi:predicted nucleic acid-binding Zn ribbon protein